MFNYWDAKKVRKTCGCAAFRLISVIFISFFRNVWRCFYICAGCVCCLLLHSSVSNRADALCLHIWILPWKLWNQLLWEGLSITMATHRLMQGFAPADWKLPPSLPLTCTLDRKLHLHYTPETFYTPSLPVFAELGMFETESLFHLISRWKPWDFLDFLFFFYHQATAVELSLVSTLVHQSRSDFSVLFIAAAFMFVILKTADLLLSIPF